MAADIRRYAEHDRERLRGLALAQVAADARAADAYLEHLANQAACGALTLFVAERDGALLGCVAVSGRVPTEGDGDELSDHALISDLYVVPAQRRRGLGLALTRCAEREAAASGATRIALKVLAANTEALDFYRSAGYEDRFVVLERVLLPDAADEPP